MNIKEISKQISDEAIVELGKLGLTMEWIGYSGNYTLQVSIDSKRMSNCTLTIYEKRGERPYDRLAVQDMKIRVGKHSDAKTFSPHPTRGFNWKKIYEALSVCIEKEKQRLEEKAEESRKAEANKPLAEAINAKYQRTKAITPLASPSHDSYNRILLRLEIWKTVSPRVAEEVLEFLADRDLIERKPPPKKDFWCGRKEHFEKCDCDIGEAINVS